MRPELIIVLVCLRYEGVFVVADYWGAFVACYYGYDVEAGLFVFDLVFPDEIFCCVTDAPAFFFVYGVLSLESFFPSSGFYLYKDDLRGRCGRVNENQVYLAVFASVIARNEFTTLFFEEFLTTSFAPPTELSAVGKKSFSKTQHP